MGTYCVVLLLNEALKERVLSLRKQYADSLLPKKTPPHITLREAFVTSRVEELLEVFHKESFCPFTITVLRHQFLSHNNLVLSVEKSNELQELHEQIMNLTQPFVEGFKEYVPDELITAEQEKLMEEFNSPYCFAFYNPHLTVARAKTKISIEDQEFSFVVNELVVIDLERNDIQERISFQK